MSGPLQSNMSTMLRDRCGSTSSAESSSFSSQPSSPPDVNSLEDPRRLRQSNSSRYKTELCRAFEEYGTCKYGEKCQFAHGMAELRSLCRHPKYKTELCRTFHTEGFCPYGKRCHFVHTPKEDMASLTPDQMKLSPMDPYAASSSDAIYLDSAFAAHLSPASHSPPTPPRLDNYYDKRPKKQPEYQLVFQQDHFAQSAVPSYRDLQELKRAYSQQALPNYNRRAVHVTSQPTMAEWQSQAIRNALNVAKSRLPVFSGLGTA